MAASYYGQPRTTIDIDFIVQVSLNDIDELLDRLARFGLKINRTRVKSQLNSGYNIISLEDKRSPYRVDLIIQIGGKLERRAGSTLGLKSYYQSPELLILSKLRMIKATVPRERSQKDKDDVRAILANTRVNKRRILNQARREGTIEIFREIFLAKHPSKKPRQTRQPDKKTAKRLKTRDKELRKCRYKAASNREDIDKILLIRDRKRSS
jgi:hypothetical protein